MVAGEGEGRAEIEEDDKGRGFWKVSPAHGCRFSAAWLAAVAAWAKEQTLQPASGNPLQATDTCSRAGPSASGSVQTNQVDGQSLPMVDGNGQTAQGSGLSAAPPVGGCGDRQQGSPGRVWLCVHLERCRMTDADVQMLAEWSWLQRQSIGIAELWLFENKITDVGAEACAQMVHKDLQQLHLSHNSLTGVGIERVLSAIPTTTFPPRPLWLRIEWNRVEAEDMEKILTRLRGEKNLIADIPEVKRFKDIGGHETKNLIYGRNMGEVHVRIPPWLTSQRKPEPAKSGNKVEDISRGQEQPRSLPKKAKGSSHFAKSKKMEQSADVQPKPYSPGQTGTSEAHGDQFPPTQKQAMAQSPQAASSTEKSSIRTEAETSGAAANPDGNNAGGPLLLFPDAGTLLTLIRPEREASGLSADVSFQWLEALCRGGRFGHKVPTRERVCFVLCNSSMKHLTALKESVVEVRQFLEQRLGMYGPKGLDFVCLLGSREGESEDVALSSREQGVDLKIIEVAQFFQKEVAKVTGAADGTGAGGAQGLPVSKDGSNVSVIVLADGQAQLLAAKSRGLPACQLKELAPMRSAGTNADMQETFTASAVRRVVGASAARGLGQLRSEDIQAEYDAMVACLKVLTDAHECATGTLGQVRNVLLQQESSDVTVGKLQALLADLGVNESGEAGGGQQAAFGGVGGLFDGGLVLSLREKMLEWSKLVKSSQAAGRVLGWEGKA
eukprot:evm.model.scf_67.9 EVM.evm.TU.scf_67.9   scf_67:155042-160471(-)